ncbi:hypothetical protein PUR71_02985 [Streptomyces sp. SP17BM10]|uniref:hypothetical protein n=1 Tax=Streptomyces sp. SP17BM10 TaxID=3002530 RepID=UPI002E759E06|nr:hypothetical protein [Streptomyces sp. SP17BM10]MEE1781899.1 hypothetical protein [Streptomyces sp. SP17BM10]
MPLDRPAPPARTVLGPGPDLAPAHGPATLTNRTARTARTAAPATATVLEHPPYETIDLPGA